MNNVPSRKTGRWERTMVILLLIFGTAGLMTYLVTNSMRTKFLQEEFARHCPNGAITISLIDGSEGYVDASSQDALFRLAGKPEAGYFSACRTGDVWILVGTSIKYVDTSPILFPLGS